MHVQIEEEQQSLDMKCGKPKPPNKKMDGENFRAIDTSSKHVSKTYREEVQVSKVHNERDYESTLLSFNTNPRAKNCG